MSKSSAEDLPTKIQQKQSENLKTGEEEVIQSIKNWLAGQPHLPHEWCQDGKEDKKLLNFLRGCDFSMDRCKKKLDKYFTVRTTIPEFYTNRDVNTPEALSLFTIGDALYLPDKTPEGRTVVMARMAQPDFETPDLNVLFKLVLMAADIRLELEDDMMRGEVIIIDINFPLAKHFLKVSPLAIRKFFICIQEAYPVKLCQVHLLNAPAYVEFVLTVIRPFLSEGLKNAIKIHNSIESLYEYVPRDILPEEYGGKGISVAEGKKKLFEKMVEFTSWFKEQENIKSDESKRPKRRGGQDETIVRVGSNLRQLSID